jgi:large repetitive protein
MWSRPSTVAALLLLAPTGGLADGIPGQTLRLAPVGRGSVTIDGVDALRPLDVEGSAQLSYARHPVELSDEQGNRVGGVIDALSTLELRLGLGLPGSLEVQGKFPLVLDRQTPAAFDGIGGAGLGDVGLGLKWTAIPRGSRSFGLAVDLLVTAPTGDAEALGGSGRFGVEASAIAELGGGPWRALLLAGTGAHAGVVRWRGAEVPTEALFGGALEVAPGSAHRLRLAAELSGAVGLPDGAAAPLEALASACWTPGAFALSAAGGVGLVDAIGTPDYRVLVGFGVHSDRGRQGDQDLDGIADARDRCPDVPEDRDGFEDRDGCPEDDNDGDAVADASDRCPLRAEDQDGFEDQDGCPDEDNDHDGVADARDRCRNDAEDRDGHEDTDGCPDPDNDGDGVADGADHCPAEAENPNGFEDADGCPDTPPPFIFRPRERIVFHDIAFRTGSADLLPSAIPVLDQIVTSLQAQPEVRVRIEGHTDDRGPDDRNLSLSQRRALAVVNYLIGGGVDGRRLEHAGFGETQPVESNASEEGRAKNRRVEIVTLDR